MAKIRIEEFDATRHRNPMVFVDDGQAIRQRRTKGLAPYKVCLVEVCGFEFIFHSDVQLELCCDYYRRPHHPSGRLPVALAEVGGDHWEMQRWFERLPQYLLEKAKRPQVLAALEKALVEYRKHEGARTGTPKPGLFGW